MAMIRFPEKAKKGEKKYRNEDAISKVLTYIFNPAKTPNAIIGATGVNVYNIDYMIKQFTKIQKFHKKQFGKRIIHFWISFSKSDEKQLITLEDYRYLGYTIANYFSDHQVAFALHEDTGTYHIHFAVNPVNIKTGYKFRWQYQDTANLKSILKKFNV